MREYEPKLTIGAMMDFERMTGVRSLSEARDVLSSVSNMTALLYCAVKHQFPRLSYAKFAADITPEQLGDALPALTEEITNFFQRFGRKTEQGQPEPGAETN
jgi:hypothetical protein